jgi:flagellar biosynthesis protein FlhG
MTSLAPTQLHAVPATAARAHGGRLIAVASGKGGVGKTWLAITLSHALARAGQRVLLFDGDLGLANVDIQLGLTPTADLGAVIAGRVALRDAAVAHAGGFDILAGHSGSGALANMAPAALEQLLAALRTAAAGYDAVLLDLGAGVERPVRRFAAFADLLLVVVTEEPTSLTDAYAVLKLHGADTSGRADAAGIVVNNASSRAAGERTYLTLSRACENFLGRTPPCLGIIRRDDHVREAIRRQTLMLERHPACAAAIDVEALAATLGTAATLRAAPSKGR